MIISEAYKKNLSNIFFNKKMLVKYIKIFLKKKKQEASICS